MVLVLVVLFSEDASAISWKPKRCKDYFKIVLFILFGAFYSYYSIGFILISSTVSIIIFVAFNEWVQGKFAFQKVFFFLALIFFGFLLSAIPALNSAFNTVGGVNYFKERSFWGAFANSGTFVQSIIPIPGSLTRNVIVDFLPALDQRFIQFQNLLNGAGLFFEGWVYVIPTGVVLLLLFSFFLFGRFRENSILSKDLVKEQDKTASRILILIVFSTFFWSLAGGAGTIMSLFSVGALRGFSRLNVFAICAILLLACRLISKLFTEPNKNYGLKLISFMLVLFTFSDILSTPVATKAGFQNEKYESLTLLTSKFPKNCPILQFPVVHYPYQSPGYPGYSLLAPGLSRDGRNYRWSAGSVGGSPGWVKLEKFTKYQNFQGQNLDVDAKKSGFCAILVDVNAWKHFENFRPFEEFVNTPRLNLDLFLMENPYLKNLNIAYGDYYFSIL
jgi:hypothetical protein